MAFDVEAARRLVREGEWSAAIADVQEAGSPEEVAKAYHALGKALYYATSLLKANGAAEEEWRPYAERTRQIFRYLAEHQEPAALAAYEKRVEAEFEKITQRRTNP